MGHPVPGTELRVVQPDTLEPLPAGEQGLVLARGPGVLCLCLRVRVACVNLNHCIV